jgi:allophanate hydrolase
MPMTRWTVPQISLDVSEGRISSEQVARQALQRADDYDAIQPQAWICRRSASAVLADARRVDARLAAGEQLALAGVPYAVKDNLDVQGMQTTAGCPEFAYAPARSATVVQRLEAAGAVLIGKTNLDQFATGLVGTRSPYGAPACVFNRDYISGGSSSGSAVVVAAGVVPLALGSDTAGSGRVPAAINGLVGFKPSRGRWSTRGLVPACRSLDCVSSFTMDAAGAARVDSVLAAFDDEDPYSRAAPPPAAPPAAPLRFGLARDGELDFLGDSEARALYERVPERLAVCGGRAIEVDLTPLLEAARLLYSGPWVAERAVVVEDLLRRRPAAVHPVVRSIIQAGLGVSAVETFRAFHALQTYLRAAQHLWRTVDVLVLPTAPTVYRVAEVLAEPVLLNSHLGTYTNFVNLLDMSAIAVPAGFRRSGTGFGVTLIGPAWSDPDLLGLAGRYAQAGEAAPAPAPDLSARAPAVKLAVVGAHLAGQPLHWQLASRNARLVGRTRTAPVYRLYAMSGQSAPKPALVHAGGGAAIEVEVYELAVAAFGDFVAEVPPPLAIGSIELEDGTTVRGFVAEPRALAGAEDITAFGGWRSYVEARMSREAPPR